MKTRKTVGGGGDGRDAAGLLGRRRMYTMTRKSEKSIRLIGEAIVALCLFSAIYAYCGLMHSLTLAPQAEVEGYPSSL